MEKDVFLNSLDLISYMIFAHFQTRRDFYWGRPFSREEGATYGGGGGGFGSSSIYVKVGPERARTRISYTNIVPTS